ncbi:hypothetical protein ACTCUF_03975 [Lactococcus lactis]|uniref:hypothetical protein n=1 Tax=Lactococcus lactis TaxID=1358 RepID=UPI003F84CE9F
MKENGEHPMRFREQQIIIDDNFNNITLEVQANGNNTVYTVTNSLTLTKAIRNISIIGAFDIEINSLQKIGFSIAPIGDITIQASLLSQVSTLINTIAAKAYAIKTSIDLSLPEQTENSITIGLPEYTQFQSVSYATTELTKALSIISGIENYRSEINIQNFDSGSLWLEVCVAGSATVGFIGFIVKTAFSLVSQYRGLQMQKLSLKSMDDEVSEKNKLYKGLEDIYKYQVRQTLENALTNENKEIDSEDLNKLSKAVELIVPLLEQGATFAPASAQNPDIKAEFPAIEAMKALAPQKLIENTSKE